MKLVTTLAAFALSTSVALAAPPAAPAPAKLQPAPIPAKGGAPSGSVHVNAVHVAGACHAPATFTVDILNNLNRVAHLGDVFVGPAGQVSNHAGTPYGEFRNVAAGAHASVRIATPWQTACAVNEVKQAQCFDIIVLMEPDGTANGEVWDGQKHRVCGPTALVKGDAPYTDTIVK